MKYRYEKWTWKFPMTANRLNQVCEDNHLELVTAFTQKRGLLKPREWVYIFKKLNQE